VPLMLDDLRRSYEGAIAEIERMFKESKSSGETKQETPPAP